MNRIHELIGSAKNDVPVDTHPIPFLMKVDEIKRDNKKLTEKLSTYKTLASEMAISVTETKDLENQIDTLTAEIRKIMSETKDKLQVLKTMSRENMSSNIHSVLCNQLVKLMTEFQSIQTAHRDRMQTRLIGKLRYLHPNLSEDEILQIVNKHKNEK
uniref:Syntaxin N-terminal domain-containing protein n=1 Tax=viral metagenome TaxID=1070528 RepID=A0A6C0JW56_9ZZZZ